LQQGKTVFILFINSLINLAASSMTKKQKAQLSLGMADSTAFVRKPAWEKSDYPDDTDVKKRPIKLF